MRSMVGGSTLIMFAVLSGACGDGEGESADSAAETRVAPNVFEVVARGLAFQAPDTAPSGWTTFRFSNESELIHFALVERLPAGIGVAEQQEEVAPVFQQGMDLLAEGDTDAAMEKFAELPAWFGDIVFMGGPGLTSPGHTSEATVYLDPGTYLLECYVKTGGIFHSYNPVADAYGMVHEFTVTDQASQRREPTPTMRLTISAERGIEVDGEPTPGTHIVAVRFEDQTVHENFVGHDVHLVRIGEDIDLEALGAWMDWSRPHGLETPAPAEFLGGTNEMPAGTTAYFRASLQPGRYAWIAEVPTPADKNMLVAFDVAEGAGSADRSH